MTIVVRVDGSAIQIDGEEAGIVILVQFVRIRQQILVNRHEVLFLAVLFIVY